MTRPTDTSESSTRYGIFREDATAYTSYEALRGLTYEDRVGAEIALEALKKELSLVEHNYLEVRQIKSGEYDS